MSASNTPGPVETAIREKLAALLNPTNIVVRNDSWKHSHHEAMRNQEDKAETHFQVDVVSEAFKGKTTMQRHRMIYGALSEELSKGLHALSLKTKTPEEIVAAAAKEATS
ncbi:hypothetical protein M422DRAFT_27987 [Sphaerobolus stellatus SS14]|nr:hypothetical protein M422DRAFT_27987 [Sphaerobolus stellatus SS14]